jgi:hypothetical protein
MEKNIVDKHYRRQVSQFNNDIRKVSRAEVVSMFVAA